MGWRLDYYFAKYIFPAASCLSSYHLKCVNTRFTIFIIHKAQHLLRIFHPSFYTLFIEKLLLYRTFQWHSTFKIIGFDSFLNFSALQRYESVCGAILDLLGWTHYVYGLVSGITKGKSDYGEMPLVGLYLHGVLSLRIATDVIRMLLSAFILAPADVIMCTLSW